MNKKIELISLVSFSLIFLSVFAILTVKSDKLREKIYQERLEYTKAYYGDLIETLEDYYENEISWLEDYYEMKIKLLDKDTLSIDQVMDDLDDLMEWTIRYYEVEPQTIRDVMELTEYILWKDAELYERILNYFNSNYIIDICNPQLAQSHR